MFEPTLPGLAPEDVFAPDAGLLNAAKATVSACIDSGLMSQRDALAAQMLLAVSARAGTGLREPKVTIATTNLLAMLERLVAVLPAEDSAVADAAQQFLAEVAAASAAANAAQ